VDTVVADSRGIPDFGLLHADFASSREDRLLYYAFDLLYLDGFDLRAARLAGAKRMLAELLAGASERILYAEHLHDEQAAAQIAASVAGHRRLGQKAEQLAGGLEHALEYRGNH
jgi:ATP-dependent DNA ligase